MNKDIINHLRDPHTFEELILNKDGVVNTSQGKTYPFEKDILKFIDEEDIEGNNKKYLKLYNKIAPLYNLANRIYFLFKFGGERKYRDEFLSELDIKPHDRV